MERTALGEPEALRAESEPALPPEGADSETLREAMRNRLRETERAAARDIAVLKVRERLRAHAGDGRQEPSTRAQLAAAKVAEIVAEVAGRADPAERALRLERVRRGRPGCAMSYTFFTARGEAVTTLVRGLAGDRPDIHAGRFVRI